MAMAATKLAATAARKPRRPMPAARASGFSIAAIAASMASSFAAGASASIGSNASLNGRVPRARKSKRSATRASPAINRSIHSRSAASNSPSMKAVSCSSVGMCPLFNSLISIPQSPTSRRCSVARHPHAIGEFRPRRRQPAHDGADRHTQDFRHLAIGKPLDIGQKHGRALRLGQRLNPLQHLSRQDVRFGLAGTVENQRLIGIDEAMSHAYPARTNFVQPYRMEDGEEPAIQSRARCKLRRPLQRPDAGRLHEIVGHVALARQHHTIAPQPRQMLGQARPDILFARYGILHGIRASGSRRTFRRLRCSPTISRNRATSDRHHSHISRKAPCW
ncbi:hypothetical protein RHSP_10785 [Rhizobium freirei PRF 81]|uniref:Uncharacterized protein n=1 Tax=Rhizobium freirei PRF 81 TaxID=363754 RepID=N6UFF1_9HYPH|nr:hypothetical protein RHSP_10785 [Rhizobium freirei PRF 81]